MSVVYQEFKSSVVVNVSKYTNLCASINGRNFSQLSPQLKNIEKKQQEPHRSLADDQIRKSETINSFGGRISRDGTSVKQTSIVFSEEPACLLGNRAY